VNRGRTALAAQRVARVVKVRARAPLRNVTRTVTFWRAAPERRSGTETVTRVRPGRTVTVRTRCPPTENVTRRMSRPETVIRARRVAHRR
jgi:hypothetical protein